MSNYTHGYEKTMKLAGLEKQSARRGQKVLRRMLERGDTEGANRLSQQMHSRSQSVPGYTPREHIKELGAGSEGVADAISTPHGVRVLKQYNPHSQLVNDRMLNRKSDFFHQMQDRGPVGDVGVARLYGERQVGQRNPVRSFEHEYVGGKSVKQLRQEAGAPRVLQDGQFVPNPKRQALDAGHASRQRHIYNHGETMTPGSEPGTGIIPTDIFKGHGQNVIRTPDGQYKIIDTVPMLRGEHPGLDAKQFNMSQNIPSSWLSFSDAPPIGSSPALPNTNPRMGDASGVLTGGEQKAWMHRGVTLPSARRGPTPQARTPVVSSQGARTPVVGSQGARTPVVGKT